MMKKALMLSFDAGMGSNLKWKKEFVDNVFAFSPKTWPRNSGERRRLACWFGRPAQTIFVLVVITHIRPVKVRDGEDTIAGRRAACAPRSCGFASGLNRLFRA
jgi:hypothetical protein